MTEIKEVQNQSSIDKIKKHLDKYKVYYISAGVLVVGIGIGYLIGKKIDTADAGQELIVKAKSISDSPIINNSTITQNIFQGHLSKIVRCVETGEIWDSIRAASDDLGISPNNLSKDIQSNLDVNGRHFEIIGLGSRS